MFTLYSADYINAPSNCSYPHKFEVTDTDSFADAVRHDYVCAEYMNHYRNGDNFLGSDCLPVDCDNDHSENPDDWVTPADVLAAFPGITFAVHYSRFNMREKNGKPARPKFHVLFPIEYMTDAAAYSEMKKLVNTIFPYFDTKALDAARFFFGTANPEVELYSGEMTLSEYLSAEDFDADMPGGFHGGTQVIPEGSRNATMSRFAGRVIKKYGDSKEAFNCFLEEANKCTPPLEQQELMTIWHSAQKFYAKVRQQDGYVPPEMYNDENSYKKQISGLSTDTRTKMAIAFCEKIRQAGFKPGVYANPSFMENYYDKNRIVGKYDIWLAHWTNSSDRPSKYNYCQTMWQWGLDRIGGYDVDGDICFCEYVKSVSANKTVDELADEVLAGKWDNGAERERLLTAAGYDYNAVQKRVNEKLYRKTTGEIAVEVIAGLWGNGAERKEKLTEAGYDYSEVQKRVNEMLR